MKTGLTIGELARELHLNPKTVRYYEEVGLLPNPQRSESGYRLYSGHEVERLRLIRRAKLLGLSLVEIKELVEYAIDGRCSALEHRLLSLVETKLGEIDQKIRDLSIFQKELTKYQRDLSARSASALREGVVGATPTPCHCIGEEVDRLRK
jgi:DNA-binding transcriptional MerR regulator